MTGLVGHARSVPMSFMRWWLGELGSFLPSRLKPGADRSRAALILDVRRHETLLTVSRPKGEETVARLTRDHAHDDLAPLAALGERGFRRWPLIVRLAPDLGMRKTIDLPLAARAGLSNLLRFELDRLTPFKADDVHLAFDVIETDQPHRRMTVALEMAPKAAVQQALDLAAGYGRSVDRVEIDREGTGKPLNLLPKATTSKGEGGWLRRMLPVMAIGLALVAAWIPFDRQNRMIDQLDQRIDAVKATAEEVLALRDQLDSRLSKAGFLAEAKTDHVGMTRLLATLTELLPDQSHLVQLEITGNTIRLQGLADKASELITILDRSDMFDAPQFRSPVIRDQRIGKERFQMTVELAEPTS